MKDFLFTDPNNSTKEIQIRTDGIGSNHNFSVVSVVGENDESISLSLRSFIIGKKIKIGKYYSRKDFIEYANEGGYQLILQDSNGNNRIELTPGGAEPIFIFDYTLDFDFE